jgi:hypothetical protein
MILVSHDDTAGMALLLKQDQLGNLQITDFNAEACQNLSAHAVAAVAIFHSKLPLSINLLPVWAENLPKLTNKNCITGKSIGQALLQIPCLL